VSRIEQSGWVSLRRPKPPIKGGSTPEEEDEKKKHLKIQSAPHSKHSQSPSAIRTTFTIVFKRKHVVHTPTNALFINFGKF